MDTRITRTGALALVIGAGIALAATGPSDAAQARAGKVVAIKDARLKFEINATDRDGGIQVFLDADSWAEMSIFDPSGNRVFTSTATGRVGEQGGTELFLESAEPPFAELPIPKLLERFPAGRYTFRGQGLAGERYVGAAQLTHNLPAGPRLVSPLPRHGLQRTDDTTMVWRRVPRPNGSPIIGYQVLVVRKDTGLRALPKVILDVMMPPTATRMRVPPGFLRKGTTYEWEVLAIERSGNQTLSAANFRTGK